MMARVSRLCFSRSWPSATKGNTRRGWTLLDLAIFGGASICCTRTERICARTGAPCASYVTVALRGRDLRDDLFSGLSVMGDLLDIVDTIGSVRNADVVRRKD